MPLGDLKIEQQIYLDGHYWVVTMLTKGYATIERVDNPKIWKMIRTQE